MFRTQPPGFRWLVGGFAVLAGLAFGARFVTGHDRPSLVFAVICFAIAGYWLIFDQEPGEAGNADAEAGQLNDEWQDEWSRPDRDEAG